MCCRVCQLRHNKGLFLGRASLSLMYLLSICCFKCIEKGKRSTLLTFGIQMHRDTPDGYVGLVIELTESRLLRD